MDRDPSWTPCRGSSHGTCQIWPNRLAKLHAPRKTRKTPWRNYARELGTQNWWGNAHRAVWSHWSNQQRSLTNCRSIAQDIEWWTVQNSNSTQRLSCVTKQSSSLTKAVHGTAWNTSAAGLQVLPSVGFRDLSNKAPWGLQQFWTLLAKIAFFCTAAFAVDISAHTSQMTLTAWVALGMLMHFALTMLWGLAKAGFMLRLRVHSLKANGGHIAWTRS